MAFSDWSKKIGDFTQKTMDKSKSLAEITKLNLVIRNSEDEINKRYIELGTFVCDNNLLCDNEQVSEIIKAINEQKAVIQANQEKIEQIRNRNICAQCGMEFSQDSNFCLNCGAQIKKELSVQSVCASCGSPLEEGTAFCGECGAKQELPTPTAP